MVESGRVYLPGGATIGNLFGNAASTSAALECGAPVALAQLVAQRCVRRSYNIAVQYNTILAFDSVHIG